MDHTPRLYHHHHAEVCAVFSTLIGGEGVWEDLTGPGVKESARALGARTRWTLHYPRACAAKRGHRLSEDHRGVESALDCSTVRLWPRVVSCGLSRRSVVCV
jgi:hypothetical protein